MSRLILNPALLILDHHLPATSALLPILLADCSHSSLVLTLPSPPARPSHPQTVPPLRPPRLKAKASTCVAISSITRARMSLLPRTTNRPTVMEQMVLSRSPRRSLTASLVALTAQGFDSITPSLHPHQLMRQLPTLNTTFAPTASSKDACPQAIMPQTS